MNIYSALHLGVELKHYTGSFSHVYDEVEKAYICQDGAGNMKAVPLLELVQEIWTLGGNGIPEGFQSPQEFVDFVGDTDQQEWSVDQNGKIYMSLQASLKKCASAAGAATTAPPASAPAPSVTSGERFRMFEALGERAYSYQDASDLGMLYKMVEPSSSFFIRHEVKVILIGRSELNFEQGAFINTNNILSKKRGPVGDFLRGMHEINSSLRGYGSNLRFVPSVNQMRTFGTNLVSGLKAGHRPRVAPDFLYLAADCIDEEYMNMLDLTESFLTDLKPNEATLSLLAGKIPPPAALSSTKISDEYIHVLRRCQSDLSLKDFPGIFATLSKGKSASHVLKCKWSFHFNGADFVWHPPGSQVVDVLPASEFGSAKNRPFPLEGTFSYNDKLYKIGEDTIKDDGVAKHLSVKDGALYLSCTPIATDKHFITESIARKVMAGIMIDNYALNPASQNFLDLCKAVYEEKDKQKKQNKLIALRQKFENAKGQEKTNLGVEIQQLVGHANLSLLMGREEEKKDNETAQAQPQVQSKLEAPADLFV